MKVQRFEGLSTTYQVFNSNSNNNSLNKKNNKVFYDMDSVDNALLTDSIDDPILPQIVRKFKKAYNILFPAKVVKEAKNIKDQIDEWADDHTFVMLA